jgi:transcriptional regulator with XRE-family HTH domain
MSTTQRIDVTLKVQARHTILHKLIKYFGSQDKLAEALGVSKLLVADWYKMKDYPRIKVRQKNGNEWLLTLEKAFYDLTEMTLDDLFPEPLRQREFLESSKTLELERSMEPMALTADGTVDERYLLPDPSQIAEQTERVETIREEVERLLVGRDKQVLLMRWGLTDDGIPMRYGEIAEVLKVTKSRIHQLERRALRKLSQSPQLRMLDPGGKLANHSPAPDLRRAEEYKA